MEEDSSEFQAAFVDMLKEYPILFSKSQLPEIRRKKTQAIEGVKFKILELCNKNFSELQISKKIMNMRSRLKTKTDLRRTGNKPIILKNWEKVLLELMEGGTNPSITRVRGKNTYLFISNNKMNNNKYNYY